MAFQREVAFSRVTGVPVVVEVSSWRILLLSVLVSAISQVVEKRYPRLGSKVH